MARRPGGEEALHLCAEVQPDVILMDMVIPGMDGATATRAIRERHPQVQVVALTSFQEDDLVQNALQMRANSLGYREIEAELSLFPNSPNPSGIYSRIFRNEIYIGRLKYGGRVCENFVPPLATPEQWERVQEQHYERRKGTSFATKAGKTSYLLSGLCKCFYCQSSMHGSRNKRNDRLKFWRFYVCAKKWAKRDKCISKQVSAERLERAG